MSLSLSQEVLMKCFIISNNALLRLISLRKNAKICLSMCIYNIQGISPEIMSPTELKIKPTIHFQS
jgi:hypothetical protein